MCICNICSEDIKKRGFDREISDNRGDALKTRGGYDIYNVYLCRKGNYIKRSHERRDIIKSIK